MNTFVYPARIRPAEEGGWLIAYRDFPEGISQAGPRQDAIDIAEGCLQACIEGRLEDGMVVPPPSAQRAGEVLVAVPLETATKAALFAAVSESGLSRVALAKAVGSMRRGFAGCSIRGTPPNCQGSRACFARWARAAAHRCGCGPRGRFPGSEAVPHFRP